MKDDPEFNIKFVALVEEHSCLYDHHQADYSNRTKQDIAWENISQKVKGTVSECKERWKNLRGCYTRHLKNKLPSGSSAKVKRSYYLSEYMQFLMPFTKSRKQTGNISILSNITTTREIEHSELSENVNENDFDISDVPTNVPVCDEEDFSEDGNQLTFNDEFQRPEKICTIKPLLKTKQRGVQLDDVNRAAVDFFNSKKKKIVPEEEDPDLSFLKSLLPDMKSMNDDQKRRYKMQMISVAGSILSEPKLSSNQQQCNLFESRGYYYGNTRPTPSSSVMSSSSSNSSIIPLQSVQSQQQNINSSSINVSSPSSKSSVHESSEDVNYNQQWYTGTEV